MVCHALGLETGPTGPSGYIQLTRAMPVERVLASSAADFHRHPWGYQHPKDAVSSHSVRRGAAMETLS